MKKIKQLIKWILLLGGLFLCAYEFVFLVYYTKFCFEKCQKHQWNYEKIQSSILCNYTGIFAKEILPQEAKVSIASSHPNLCFVAARYQLYPLIVQEKGDYIIDLGGKMSTLVKKDYQKYRLPTDINIYAQDGHPFLTPKKNKPSLSIFQFFIFSFYLAVFYILIGDRLLKMLKIPFSNWSHWGWKGLCYLVGYLVFTGCVWIFLHLGGALSRENILIIMFLIILGVLCVRGKKGLSPDMACLVSKECLAQKYNVWNRVGFGAIGVVVILIMSIMIMVPVNDWDAMSHWILKSKEFYYHQNIVFDYAHHNLYPVLWPLNIAIQFALLGGMFDQVAQWSSAIFFLVFVTQILAGLKILKIRLPCSLALVFFYILSLFHSIYRPWWEVHLIFSNAENIFLAYLTALIVAFLAWIKGHLNNSFLWPMFFLGMGLVFSKFEGGVTLFMISVSLFFSVRMSLSKKMIFLGGNLFLFFLFFVWVYWINLQGHEVEFIHFQTTLSYEKIFTIFYLHTKYFFYNNLFFIFLFGLAYTFFSYPSVKEVSFEERFLWKVSILLIIFSSWAYLGLPLNRLEAAFREAQPRLFIHATPALFLLWCYRLKKKSEFK